MFNCANVVLALYIESHWCKAFNSTTKILATLTWRGIVVHSLCFKESDIVVEERR